MLYEANILKFIRREGCTLLVITDKLNEEPSQTSGVIFKNIFSETQQGSLEEKIKKMTGSLLGLKRKRKFKKPQTQGKRWKVNVTVTEK